MAGRRSIGVALCVLSASVSVFAGKPQPCVTPDDAVKMLNRDICISAHVYDVVQLSDGTRFLDLCSPDIPDDRCQFTVLSQRDDRAEVGELGQYRDRDVQIRGTVERLRWRSGMVLSHARQFSGGPPKFRPNPRLLRGFSGDQDKPPIADPNLRQHGGRRSFMNSRELVKIPQK